MTHVRKGVAWLLTAILLFFVGTGTGYITRTWECRNTLQTIFVAAPGFDLGTMDLPAKLYRIRVSACALPEQWGGDKEPLPGYP